MALYFYFNETTGDMVYSDKATYDVAGYTSLGEQTDMNPMTVSSWIFDDKRSLIKSVSKDFNMSGKIMGLETMDYMFTNCSILTNVDLSGIDGSNINGMKSAFSSCTSLIDLDLSELNMLFPSGMMGTFEGCSSLVNLNLSNLNTSRVTTMHEMFKGCQSLVNLDLSNFDTSQVTYTSNTFENCSNLRVITISDRMSNILSMLPADQYYPAAGGAPTAKADLTAGTWIRDKADLSMVTSIVEQAQMSQAISRRISKLGRDLRAEIAKASAGSASSSVDVVRTDAHSTSYTKDTLEIVTDSTGKVTEMYFISA